MNNRILLSTQQKMQAEFNLIKEIAFNCRSGKVNGLKLWNLLKTNYEESPMQGFEWAQIDKLFVADVMKLNEFYENGDMNEQVHFIIQCVRIQKKNPILSKRRLMQIAFNIGQLHASQSYIPKDIMDQFHKLVMDEMKTYISDVSSA